MAYGLHYYSEFADDWEKKYRVEIHERDYTGDTLEVTSGGNPFTLEMTEVDNIFTPIRPKKVSIEWVAEENSLFEIEDLFITDDRKYILYFYEIDDVTEDLTTLFTGYLVTVDCEEPFQSKPYHVQLAGICSLTFLLDRYFVGYFNEFTIERISIKDIIGQCLYSSGLNLDFHVYVDLHEIQMANGVNWLLETEIDADGLRGKTCYEVLEGVLNAMNAYIVQDKNIWVVKGVPDTNSILVTEKRYNYLGQYQGGGIINQSISIGRDEYDVNTPNLRPTANVVKKLADISSVVKSTISPGIAVNRLENGQFAKPILGGNLDGWNINLGGIIYPTNGIESPGWQRTGFGTIDSPFRFEMRGYGLLWEDGKNINTPTNSTKDVHIDIKNPIIIDGGLFGVKNKIKLVVSGAFRSRNVNKIYIECRINDGDRDVVSWLDESGKWNPDKKKRAGIKVEIDSVFPDLTIPVSELPMQTFEIISSPIENFLKISDKAIAKVYFRIFPGIFWGEVTPEDVAGGVAPLLALEDFAVCVTTETVYEGDHTYVVDADLPIRNSNEVSFTSIIADKINIITPEQVRLTNRVMTGYMTLASTGGLTYKWNRGIGGGGDPYDNVYWPLQFKILKERIRQLCGKRVVLQGTFLGYNADTSSSVFSQYDGEDVPNTFYTITGWKWNVIDREYDLTLNELYFEKLEISQEFIELDKNGTGSRGNRLYGNSTGSSSLGNGSSSPDIPDPIILDVIDPLYFIVGKSSTQSFDLGELITSDQLPIDLASKFVYYPSWMDYPYEDRGVDGDLLTYTVSGKPLQKGHDQIIIEFTDPYGVDYLAVVPIIIEVEVKNKNTIINGDGDLVGKVPGFLELPESWNFKTEITGTHDSVQMSVSGGGASGSSYNGNITRETGLVESGTYTVSDTAIVSDPGVYEYTVTTFRGTTQTSTESGSFTLYDEEYLAKFSAEFIDAETSEILGVINPDGSNIFTKKSGWDIKSIITDLNHDKISFSLKKDGVNVFSNEISVTPDELEGEYLLFNEIQTTYGSGKYELLVDLSLDDSAVYQRLVSFEIGVEEPKPEAGLSLIEFTPNTINYAVTQELPLFNAEFDLPDNWGVITTIPSVDYDFVEWELFDSTSGALANVNIEAYTNYPQYLNYSEGENKEPVLFFGLKNSTDIGDIHRAPSSFRAKATFRLGGSTGDIVSIFQSDFGFRVPLQPEDYSGTRFIVIDSVSGDIEVVDTDMPKIGRKYILPELGFRYSVSVREWDGSLFDKVIVKYSKKIAGSYTILHYFGSDSVLTHLTEGDVNELDSDDKAYVIGIVNLDNLRNLFDPSNALVLIDDIGEYKATFEFYLDDTLLGSKVTEFELIDSIIPDIPIKDCCGGDGADMPVYADVEGVWGGNNKILKVNLTENGTVSAIEEQELDGVSIVDDIWTYGFPPKSATNATANDEVVNFGQLTAAVAAGSADKTPVKTVSTTNIELTGLQTINGYTTITGDRVLVQNQTNPALNGAYIAATGAWSRAIDSDTGTELLGATYLVTAGNATVIGTKWKVITQPPITIDTTPITIIQVEAAETDPTVPAWVKAITSTQITNWDTAYTFVSNFNSYFDTRFATKTTTNLSEGTNLYFTEARARATILTGLSISNSVISASDSVLSAFGKIQGQLTNISTSGITGSGTPGRLTKYLTPTTIGDSIILEVPGEVSVQGILSAQRFQSSSVPSSNDIVGFSLYSTGSLRWAIGRLGLEPGGNVGSDLFFTALDDSSNFLGHGFSINRATQIATFYKPTIGVSPTDDNHFVTRGFANATYSLSTHTHTFASLTGKPTTIAGYGITDFNSLWDARLATKSTTNLVEGSNLYFTEARVRLTPLTGLSIVSGVISATDSVLSAFGKIQGQINSIGGSGITGSGTAGRVVKYLTSTTIGNSIMTETGSEISVSGVVSAQRFQSSSTPSASDVVGFNLYSGSSLRWAIGRLGLESGGNIGSDLYFTALDDSSNFLGQALSINRASRIATFYQPTIGVSPTSDNHFVTRGYSNATYSLIGHTHTFASLTSKPTTLAGYGITNAEPAITPGTTSQYWRGDKTWQTLPSFSGITGSGTVNFFALFSGSTSITSGALSQVSNELRFTGFAMSIGGSGSFNMSQGVGGNYADFNYENDTRTNRYYITRNSSELFIGRSGFTGSITNNRLIGFLENGSISIPVTGVNPLTVASSIMNPNLNADLLDGKHASEFALAGTVTDRFISTPIETGNINNLTNGGIRTTGESALNSPFNYGSIFTFVGNSLTGNGEATASFVNQLLVSTTTDIYHRQRLDGAWGTTYQYWTSKQFTSTNISNWNTAFSWGNHASAGYLTSINSSQIISALGYTPLRGDSYITVNGTNYPLNANPSITISGGGGGSVTSVGLSVPTGFTVTSSPVTSSGNLSFQLASNYEIVTSSQIAYWNAKMENDRTITINGGTFLTRNNPNLGTYLTVADMYGYVQGSNTITINGNTQSLGGNPVFTISGGGGGIPTDRTITINGNTQLLNNNPNFTISGGGGGVSGSGTGGYIPEWTSGSSLGNSIIYTPDSSTIRVNGRLNFQNGTIQVLFLTYSQMQSSGLGSGSIIYKSDTGGGTGFGFYGRVGNTWVFLGGE